MVFRALVFILLLSATMGNTWAAKLDATQEAELRAKYRLEIQKLFDEYSERVPLGSDEETAHTVLKDVVVFDFGGLYVREENSNFKRKIEVPADRSGEIFAEELAHVVGQYLNTYREHTLVAAQPDYRGTAYELVPGRYLADHMTHALRFMLAFSKGFKTTATETIENRNFNLMMRAGVYFPAAFIGAILFQNIPLLISSILAPGSAFIAMGLNDMVIEPLRGNPTKNRMPLALINKLMTELGVSDDELRKLLMSALPNAKLEHVQAYLCEKNLTVEPSATAMPHQVRVTPSATATTVEAEPVEVERTQDALLER